MKIVALSAPHDHCSKGCSSSLQSQVIGKHARESGVVDAISRYRRIIGFSDVVFVLHLVLVVPFVGFLSLSLLLFLVGHGVVVWS